MEDSLVYFIINDDVNEFIGLSSDAGFEPNKDLFSKFSYIHLMALSGVVKCFKHAISKNLYDLKGIALYAILGGNMEIIHILEQNGISFNDVIALAPVCRPELFDWSLNHYETGDKLQACAKFINKGMWPYALALLRKKDVSRTFCFKAMYDRDLLCIASAAGAFPLVKFLVAIMNKTHGNMGDLYSLGALCGASGRGHFNIVKHLVENYLSVTKNTVERAVRVAGNNGHLEITDYLIKYFTKKYGYNPDADTLLPLVSSYGHFDIMQHLISDFSYNANGKDEEGETALHYASKKGRLDIVKYLIEECHCNPEVKGEYGYTPLHYASAGGYLDIVKYLVEECHCNPEAKSECGYTPLYPASKAGRLNVVQYLVETVKCDVDAPDKDGRTALYWVAMKGHLDDIVKYLVEKCHATITPGIIGITRNKQEIKNYLLEQQQKQKSNQNQ